MITIYPNNLDRQEVEQLRARVDLLTCANQIRFCPVPKADQFNGQSDIRVCANGGAGSREIFEVLPELLPLGSISVKLRDKTVELDIPRTLWIVFEVQCKDKLSPRHLPVAHPKLQIPKAATFSGERANRYYQRPEYWFRGYLPSSRIDLNLLCDRSGKGSRYLEAMHRQTSAVVEILPNTLAHEARVSIIPSTEGLAIVHGDSPQWYDFLGNFSRLASIG